MQNFKYDFVRISDYLRSYQYDKQYARRAETIFKRALKKFRVKYPDLHGSISIDAKTRSIYHLTIRLDKNCPDFEAIKQKVLEAFKWDGATENCIKVDVYSNECTITYNNFRYYDGY